MKWMPIETAPKDGVGCIIGWFDQFENIHYAIAFWTESGWTVARTTILCYPTHWMPLPPAPEMKP